LHSPRNLLRLGLTVAVTSLIAGCSAVSSSSGASSQSSASVTPSAVAAPSGSQLAGILLPVSSMPSGFKADPSSTRDTGSELPSDSAAPVPASHVCQDFTETSYIQVGGITTTDFAQSDYLNGDQTEEIAEEIDVFTGTDAQKVMTSLWQAFGTCASFKYQSNGTTVSETLKRSQLPGQGGDAIKAVMVSPAFDGGQTLVAIRVGPQIITTLDSSSGSDLGSPSVGYAEQVARRLQAAR